MRLFSKIYPIEVITFTWILITSIYINLFPHCLNFTTEHHLIRDRFLIVGSFAVLFILHQQTKWSLFAAIRQIWPFFLIMYWYPETYYYNQEFFRNIDPLLIHADQWLCGFQPSTMFSVWFSAPWFAELMNFSYISFYMALFFTLTYFFIVNREKSYFAAFVLLNAFFLYYAFYIFLPAEGPQFFVCHEPANALPITGFMRRFLLFTQSLGEVPNGAFPSSHVGAMTTYMILFWFHDRKVFWWTLPFSILLAMSTVYIKAHYFIDVIVGFALAFPFYFYSVWLWKRLNYWLHLSHL